MPNKIVAFSKASFLNHLTHLFHVSYFHTNRPKKENLQKDSAPPSLSLSLCVMSGQILKNRNCKGRWQATPKRLLQVLFLYVGLSLLPLIYCTLLGWNFVLFLISSPPYVNDFQFLFLAQMVLICRNYCIWCVINFWDFIVKLDEFMVITLVVHFDF